MIANRRTTIFDEMILLRAFMILSVMLLMPLGMQPAEASGTMPHHSMPAAASAMSGHCHDEDGSRPISPGLATCTMACAAALPAVPARPQSALPMPKPLIVAASVDHLVGLEPEIATPPPRAA